MVGYLIHPFVYISSSYITLSAIKQPRLLFNFAFLLSFHPSLHTFAQNTLENGATVAFCYVSVKQKKLLKHTYYRIYTFPRSPLRSPKIKDLLLLLFHQNLQKKTTFSTFNSTIKSTIKYINRIENERTISIHFGIHSTALSICTGHYTQGIAKSKG